MNEPRQTGKRIVSKGEYAVLMSRKFILGLGSASLTIVIALGFLLAVGLAFGGLIWGGLVAYGRGDYDERAIALLYCVLCVAGAVLSTYVTSKIKQVAETGMERATQKENMLLLTRASTADLPATESLVRASEEPVQQEQAVLLRAATEGQQTPPEQLVRAADRQE